MPHKLPPLNALRVFEVAARASSFTEAGKELNLTHGAVSRQIQLLEDALKQPLFQKEGHRMVATSHAKAFAREISLAFDHISDAARRYGKASTNRVIRVNAPATFAMRWLIPHLTQFHALHPTTEVRVSTAFSNEPILKGSSDLVIRRSPGDQTQFEITRLFTEKMTVIASPAFLANFKLDHPSDLESLTLLSTESRPGDWEKWLDAIGFKNVRPLQQIRFDHFFVTLQAVIDSMGVAIGTFPTLSTDEESGRIKRPFPHHQIPGDTYFALVPRDSDKPAHLQAFQAWLLTRASEYQ